MLLLGLLRVSWSSGQEAHRAAARGANPTQQNHEAERAGGQRNALLAAHMCTAAAAEIHDSVPQRGQVGDPNKLCVLPASEAEAHLPLLPGDLKQIK